jgi:hypothetical protein
VRSLIVTALLLSLLGCGVAAPSRNPGYASFSYPEHLGLQRDTEISLGSMVLGFAARHVDDDPQTKALLKALDGVRIGVYRIADGSDLFALRDEVANAATALEKDSWRTLVRVADDDANVHVLIKQGENAVLGLTLLVINPEELVFVNVMGALNEELLASLSSSLPEGERFSLQSLSLR